MGGISSYVEDTGPYAGWLRLADEDLHGFPAIVGPCYVRKINDALARVAAITREEHGNRLDALHGGFLAGFADHAYFVALVAMGRPELMSGVTIDLSMQYAGAGEVGPGLEAEVELLRETGRMLFMRMRLLQEERLIAASSATIRKPSMR